MLHGATSDRSFPELQAVIGDIQGPPASDRLGKLMVPTSGIEMGGKGKMLILQCTKREGFSLRPVFELCNGSNETSDLTREFDVRAKERMSGAKRSIVN